MITQFYSEGRKTILFRITQISRTRKSKGRRGASIRHREFQREGRRGQSVTVQVAWRQKEGISGGGEGPASGGRVNSRGGRRAKSD